MEANQGWQPCREDGLKKERGEGELLAPKKRWNSNIPKMAKSFNADSSWPAKRIPCDCFGNGKMLDKWNYDFMFYGYFYESGNLRDSLKAMIEERRGRPSHRWYYLKPCNNKLLPYNYFRLKCFFIRPLKYLAKTIITK